MAATVTPIRTELPELPQYMCELPIFRGYPVPWFVDWFNGEPEFRAMDMNKFVRAVNQRLCWVCGHKLYTEEVFVVGPMCGVNRVSSEPPSHRECAVYSARGCPFLSRPSMERREGNLPGPRKEPAGIMVSRNPGVSLLWYTRRHRLIESAHIPKAGAHRGILFSMGYPHKVEWYREGRPATRAEVWESIESGLPLLYEANEKQGGGAEHLAEGRAMIDKQLAETMRLLPRA